MADQYSALWAVESQGNCFLLLFFLKKRENEVENELLIGVRGTGVFEKIQIQTGWGGREDSAEM